MDDDGATPAPGPKGPGRETKTASFVVSTSDRGTLVSDDSGGEEKKDDIEDTAVDIVLGELDRVVISLCEPIREARLRGDQRDGAKAFEHAIQSGLLRLRPPPWLLDELLAIAAEHLDDALAVTLRFCRIHLAIRPQRPDVIEGDARALLEGKHVLSDAQRATALLSWGHAAAMAGRRELALHRYRRALASPGITPTDRAWSYRGLSTTFGEEDDVESYAEYCGKAADAFLEAGDRENAARSLFGAACRARFRDPSAALRILREALALLGTGTDPTTIAQQAAILRGLAEVYLETDTTAHDDAVRYIHEALRQQRRLLGPDARAARRGMLHVAVRIHLARRETALAETLESELLDLEKRRSTPGDSLRRRIEIAGTLSLDAATALLGDIKASAEPHLALAFHVKRAFAAVDLDHALMELEDARNFLNGATPRDYDKQSIAVAFAVVYEKAGAKERAFEWHRRVLEVNPFYSASRRAVASYLVSNERWADAVEFFEAERARFGDRGGTLFRLGWSYLEAGRKDEALAALITARRLKPTLSKVDEFIARATAEGGRYIPRPSEGPALPSPIARQEFELALTEFADHVASAQRMTFWERDRTKKKRAHKWRKNPEAHATALLRSSLAARFGSRMESFVEAPVGAGRIDVFLLLAGGLRLVVELKMCGPSYSAAYAREGLDQLSHYMDGKGTGLGYLLVFDARARDFAKGLAEVEMVGRNTLFVRFVDVRPTIPRARSERE